MLAHTHTHTHGAYALYNKLFHALALRLIGTLESVAAYNISMMEMSLSSGVL